MAFKIHGMDTAALAKGGDRIAIDRETSLGSGVWGTFQILFSTIMTYVQANLTFPSQVLSGSAVTHTIGTAFQAHATKVVNGSYAVAINVQSLLLGTAEQRVDLFIGATSGSQTLLADTVTVKVAGVLNLNNTQTMTLKAKIPAGWYGKLVPTSVSGTANSATWVSGYEQTEG